MGFIDDYGLRSHIRNAVTVGTAVYQFVSSSLWPIFSASILVSAFHVMLMASEKQVLADHYFGRDPVFDEEKTELLEKSKKLFHEELGTTIKERVWQLPRTIAQHEYKERNIA